MRKMVIVLTILLIGVVKNANAQGIQFHKGTFEEAIQTAKQQNKLIFIDFYTTWCAPCKGLANGVFPRPEVGEVFNKMFINCKLDAEREGKLLAIRYQVTSFPTLLFVNADGEVINKVVGAVSADKLIEVAKKTVTMIDDPDNLVNLKKRYLSLREDEAFLKMYLEKMVAYKESPYEAVEDYLKVQTRIKENSAKMMEFLIQYGDLLMLGGEAERIMEANYDEFWDIATKSEEKQLENLKRTMIRLTMDYALFRKDIQLYEIFLDRWKKTDNKPYYQDYNQLKLDLFLLKGEEKVYRKEAVIYLDSVVTSRPIVDIQAKDQERYDDYCKKNPMSVGIWAEMRESYKNLDAKLQVKAIIKVGNELLKIGKRSDMKRLHLWIDYGHRLYPDQYTLFAFEAKVLYRQGRSQEAIDTQRKALSLVSSNDKKVYPGLKTTLDKMERGIF